METDHRTAAATPATWEIPLALNRWQVEVISLLLVLGALLLSGDHSTRRQQ